MLTDDSVIFAKASHNECNNINRNLHKFCVLSSQLVNFHKSVVQISNNIQRATKKRLGEALSILVFNWLSKYLSCPLIKGRIKKSSFSEMIINSQKKLASWKACFLLRADKIVLIKVLFASSPLHIMNCFKLKK